MRTLGPLAVLVSLLFACGAQAPGDDAPGSTTSASIARTAGASVPSDPAFRHVDGGGEACDDAGADDAGPQPVQPSYFSCTSDEDCVAVREIVDCCYNGWKIAVNREEAAAYLAATQCVLTPHHACPLYVVFDRRVPECNTSAHQCQMVNPEDAGPPSSGGGSESLR